MLAAFFKKYLKRALKARGDPDGWGLKPNTQRYADSVGCSYKMQIMTSFDTDTVDPNKV